MIYKPLNYASKPWMAKEELIPAEAQLVAWEIAKTEKEAKGEIETHHSESKFFST